jgi:hypothetical protein
MNELIEKLVQELIIEITYLHNYYYYYYYSVVSFTKGKGILLKN